MSAQLTHCGWPLFFFNLVDRTIHAYWAYKLTLLCTPCCIGGQAGVNLAVVQHNLVHIIVFKYFIIVFRYFMYLCIHTCMLSCMCALAIIYFYFAAYITI